LFLAYFQLVDKVADFAGHMVEMMRQIADFVPAVDLQARI